MYKVFGKRLRAEREKRELTTQMLAKMCEISRSYITLIENGKRLPGKKILPKIASALEIETIVVLRWYLKDVKQKLHKELKAP
jgi:transcriptional regulator with XRE-family HTH domain